MTTHTHTQIQTNAHTNYRWWIVVLAVIVGIVDYFDRSALGYFASPIMKAFHLNAVEFGSLSSAFSIGYFFLTFTGGWFADKIGARKLLGITGILWGLFSVGVTLTLGFWWLIMMRILLGVAEGPAYPAQFRAFADWLRGSERSAAVAYSQPVGVALALIIGGPLAAFLFSLTHAWQTMFIVIGILSIILAIIWVVMFRDRPDSSPHVNSAELSLIKDEGIASNETAAASDPDRTERNVTVTVGELMKDRTLLSTYIAFFCVGWFLWFVLAWLPTFLSKTYHISLSGSALLSALPWVVYGLLSLFAGYVADMRLKATGSSNAKRTLIVTSLLGAGLLLIPVLTVHVVWVDIVFVTLSFGFAGMSVAPVWSLNADVVPQRAGTSSGIMDAAFALAGFLAPLVTGYLVNQTHTFVASVILIAIICLGGASAVMSMSRPDESARRFREKSLPRT